MTDDGEAKDIILRGVRIGEDANGHWNLNDIWRLAGAPVSKAPKHWRTQKAVTRLIQALQKKVTHDYLKQNKPIIPVVYAGRGRGQEGTFAHPILAASYAGYLSPKLEIETRDVWLRYRSGDATLADEILERATPEANEWAATRALGRVKRNEFTAALQAHGVDGFGYAVCTDAIYETLFDARTKALKESRGVPANSNLRDTMASDELVSVMFAEMLAKQRIDAEGPYGNRACEDATRRSTRRVRATIEEDRSDRQDKRLAS